MLIVVKKVLESTSCNGVHPDNKVLVQFSTQCPDVIISEHLKEKFPERMAIVLQHQFYNLKLQDNGFSVSLKFSGTLDMIYVPFKSILMFSDPLQGFKLEFDNSYSDQDTRDNSATTQQGSNKSNIISIADLRRRDIDTTAA